MTLPVRGFTGPLVTRGLGAPFASISAGWWLADPREVAAVGGWTKAPVDADLVTVGYTTTTGWVAQPVEFTPASVPFTEGGPATS